MILRKPYAFLIKHFRLLHGIITACMVYLIMRSYKLFSFLGTYIKSGTLRLDKKDFSSLFNKPMFILPILIIVILLILLVVMIRKHKPKPFYFFNILVYALTFVLYFYIQSTMSEMQFVIVSSQVVKLLRDLSEMLVIAQLVTIGMCLIRALGLDLKKFDFNKDLVELDIDDVDNEEFEVSVNFDSTNITRLLKKKFRYFRYFYLENEKKFKFAFVLLLVIICTTIVLNIIKRNSISKQYTPFSVGQMTMQINDVYLVKNDYLGNSIYSKDTNRLVVVTLKVKSTKRNDVLNTARTALVVGRKTYYPTTEYNKQVSDLGVLYANQKLISDYRNYMLVYEIPTSEVSRTMRFKYLSSLEQEKKKLNENYTSVTLKYIDIDKITSVTDRQLGETIKLNPTILKNSVFELDTTEIAEYFDNNYRFCLGKGECYDSVEHIYPTLNSTQDKIVLKINAKLVMDDEISSSLATNLESVISSFGKITYVIGTKTKTYNSLEVLAYSKSKKDNIAYFEIPKEVLNARDIVLRIKIRNEEYRYNIEL